MSGAEADHEVEDASELELEPEGDAESESEAAEIGSVADDLLAAFGAPTKKAEPKVEAEAEPKVEAEAEAKVEAEADQLAPADDPVDDAPTKAERSMSAAAPELDPAAFFDMLRGSGGGQDDADKVSTAPTATIPQAQPATAEPVTDRGAVEEVVASPHTEPDAPPQPPAGTMPWPPYQGAIPSWPAAPQPPAKRRVLPIVLRWGAAALTAAAVGAGTAFAVTLPKRTDVPGLATKGDGRYSFLFVAKPARPAGTPTPKEDRFLTHPADLREYLLPAPVGATPDPAYPGASGWRSPQDFLADFAYADSMTADLGENGLRRIAAEGWTTPDGQHTMIELLQFPDNDAASQVDALIGRNSLARLKDPVDTGEKVDVVDLDGTSRQIEIDHYARVESDAPKIIAPKEGRSATFTVGDVAVVVITTGPDHMPNVPTEQIVLLQSAMLR